MKRAEMRRAADACHMCARENDVHWMEFWAKRRRVPRSQLCGKDPRNPWLEENVGPSGGLKALRVEASLLLTEAERWEINGLP